MFAKHQLNDLAERKHLLVMEAGLHRGLIVSERENLRARLAGFQLARGRVGDIRSLLIAGGVAAGLLAARRWRKLARWMPWALTALRWMRSLKGR